MENQGRLDKQIESDEKAGCFSFVALAVVLIAGLLAMIL
jgi:hypothetical protein